jgi:cell division protein FtsI (penicillin-binding protein 3)
MEPTALELVEAPSGRPLYPERWGELSTMTISYGHGISTSPVHLAAAYAAMVNGGTMVTPTLLRHDPTEATLPEGARVISRPISARMRYLLRSVVTDGTASFGEVEGYSVGGKTGSAEMPRTRGGGYYEDRNINTFAAVFPVRRAAIRADHHALRTRRAIGAGAAPHGGLDHGSGLRRVDPPRSTAAGPEAGR